MRPFEYMRAVTEADAVHAAASQTRDVPATDQPIQFLAGGTNMTDYMRLEVLRPERVVDIARLDAKLYGQIEASAQGLRLGALVRMSEAEDHPVIARDYPMVRDSLYLAASRQIRNMATLGGNPLQRTRCEYFREISFPCNKREPGSGCSARDGVNRQHAILGTSDACIATYPGDFAQALIALDASVQTLGPKGKRTIPFAKLHRLPGSTPHLETTLEPGELITFIHIPAGPWTRRSRYVKVRDRTSYQFALASAAVALELEGDRVRTARIGLGGVATVPWRAIEAEQSLAGEALNEQNARAAAEIAFANAAAREHNRFKIELGKQTLVRALLETRDMKVASA
jgi:xanthine dehydrogenase YagS FAD-binding subunit